MSRLRPLDVRRRPRVDLDDEDLVAPLGSSRAHLAAQREHRSFVRELERDNDDRASPSYIRPVY